MNKQYASEPELEARVLIHQAGLSKAAMEFPEDVAIAMKTAAQARNALAALTPIDVVSEPWPPMQARNTV
ncbi:MAG TPA: hypothetical protein VIP51_13160 [Eoetvoesiella sp.]